MRHQKDRRTPQATSLFPFRDNADVSQRERRKTGERRIENLDAEERQLMLSEMPSPTRRKPR
jgi:hypothetical protein